MKFGSGGYRIRQVKYETPHEKYLDLANAVSEIHGKKVLEVGGSTPPKVVCAYSPNEWTSVNLDARAVTSANEEARELKSVNYSAMCDDIRTLDRTGHYDLIYSVNAFEHIHNLDTALDRMFFALMQGGYLFTMFGPIWSSDVGHHLSIRTENGHELNFFDGVLSPWEHLTSSREGVFAKLARRYGESTAQRAVSFIYDFYDLNRLAERDYMQIVRESRFSPVVILRHKVGRPPKLSAATSTREFLMILKKGPATQFERGKCLSKFALAFAGQQIRRRLLS